MDPTPVPLEACVRAHYLAQDVGGCCFRDTLEGARVSTTHLAARLTDARARAHPDCVALGELLLAMTANQRRKVCERGYAKHAPPREGRGR